MSSSNMIVLKSSDGETFEVEEAVALESQKIKVMIEEDRFDSPLPDVTTKILSIGDVTSKILSMVIEYCKKHVDTPAEDLKSFDSDLVKVDQGTLFDLILAAKSLDIKRLLDVGYEAVGDMIKGKTAEEIRMTFNIENDFTPEEEQQVYMETAEGPSEFGQKQVSLDDPQTSKRMRMSEYIVSSSHQKEIMMRLPVASVLECRRVSKAWKSLIDNPQFITAHSHHRRTHSRLLLVSNRMLEDDGDDFYHPHVRYLSIRDDDTFPHQQSKLTPPLPIGELFGMVAVGSSHGLMCLNAISAKLRKEVAVLWNPTIRKTVVVPYPVPQDPDSLGFGVCPVTGDPKLLMVNFHEHVAKIFTWSSREWRSIPLPPHATSWSPTTTDKFLYSCTGSGKKKLVSFDLTHETYEVTRLPKAVASFKYTCKIGDSFAVVVPHSRGSSVWILEGGGAQTSHFTKLYNISCSPKSDCILASRTNGKLIVLRKNPTVKYCAPRDSKPPSIAAYVPTYDDYYPLPIDKVWYDIHVEPYEQTLLLLDCHATMIGG